MTCRKLMGIFPSHLCIQSIQKKKEQKNKEKKRETDHLPYKIHKTRPNNRVGRLFSSFLSPFIYSICFVCKFEKSVMFLFVNKKKKGNIIFFLLLGLTVNLLSALTSTIPLSRFWQSGGTKCGMWKTPRFTFSNKFLRLSSSNGNAPWTQREDKRHICDNISSSLNNKYLVLGQLPTWDNSPPDKNKAQLLPTRTTPN